MPTAKREKWSKHFGTWYRKVLIEAGIADYRYPIKGCGVWMPYGFQIRKYGLQILRDLLDATGHNEVLFPLLIPETSLQKEAAHVKSFEAECFWITRGGLTPLDVKLALRPTSETVIGPMLKLWIRSHADLPLKLYQIVNVFRYETKATRPLIRVREVSTFKEAHTSHATLREAEEQIKEATRVYKQFFDELNVPYRISRRPEWDKFAGAMYTDGFDTVLPDGRTLQIGTVHNLGQNFSKAFDITYETENGQRENIWQTCYGISERWLAAVLSVHGDDNGAVLPPKIAPIQVIIIPIPHKEKSEEINNTCVNVCEKLKKSHIRARVDLREELTPGAKFFDWELKGVPIRVEIGPRDIEHSEVVVVRRDTFEKTTCKMDKLTDYLQLLMEKMAGEMREKARKWMKEHIHKAKSLEDVKQLLKKRAGIVEVSWCGETNCGLKMEEEINGKILGIPQDEKEKPSENCIVCGKEAKTVVRVAVAY
ncbi:MAG: proline--tRNA ligase [Candidatus Bathyarchaeia archaeon]|jgi:prolyl-tRNA synthetase|nr:proline--tRNA ligase [Candidatus Bathyarchaeota archaeon A05DMB-4]MDH7595520.1 proline--tRNA ligase [Candidatus Bathyarchaeota archaeon]